MRPSASTSLLLLPCVFAVRQMDMDFHADLKGGDDEFKTFEEMVESGAKIQSELTCDQIKSQMVTQVTKANDAITALFDEADNPVAIADAESGAVLAGDEITALASAADLMQCLPEAMTDSPAVQAGINTLLQTHLPSVLFAPTQYGADSLEMGYQRLVTWQQGMVDLAGPDLERTVVFPQDIEERDNCPEECGMCTLEHNSWRKGEERFRFKCLLQRGQDPPSVKNSTSFDCTEPRRRRSFWRPHRYGRKSWCTVKDWQDLACRQLRVTTLMGCGVDLITAPLLQHWNDSTIDEFSSHQYFDCVKWETTLENFGSMHYRYGHAGHRPSVPDHNKLAFRIIMALGLSNGLAALRAASRPSDGPPGKSFEELLTVFLQGFTVDDYYRTIFNGEANADGRVTFDGEVDTKGDITRECSSLIADIDRCRPSWKTRNANFPIRAWRFSWRLISVVQNSALIAGSLFVINAGTMAALGFIFAGGNLGALFVGGGITFLSIMVSIGAALGAVIGYESYALKDYGYNPRCAVDAPRGRLSWTEMIEDARQTPNSLD